MRRLYARMTLCFSSALALMVACSNQADVAVRHASRNSACPENQVRAQEMEDNRFKTVGCGEVAVYECWNDACWKEGRLAPKAIDRAAREFGCPASEIRVRWIRHETYRVEGCKHGANYDCDDDGCETSGAPKSEMNIIIAP